MNNLITILTIEFIVALIATMVYNESSNPKVRDICGCVSILGALSMIIIGIISIFV
jgi:hypothetical protein